MMDYPALKALAAVLRYGSFDGAATMLNVTPSAISQRIKNLEDQHGGPLVIRSAPCMGTDAGKRLARHAENVSLLEMAVNRDIAPAQLEPQRVRIAANADSLATWLVGALAQSNNLLFDVEIDDQDHAAQWLIRGEVAAAISASSAPIAGCDSYPLGALRYRATASPAFVERHFSDGVTLPALSKAPAMIFNAKDRLQERWIDANFGKKTAMPHHRLPSTQAFIDGATAGLGWGLNPEPLLQDSLDQGKLKELIPNTPLDTPLFWVVSRAVKVPLQPLTNAILRAAKLALIEQK